MKRFEPIRLLRWSLVGIASVFGLLGLFVSFSVICIHLNCESDVLVRSRFAINTGLSWHKHDISMFAVRRHATPTIPAGRESAWAAKLPMRSLSLAGLRCFIGQRALLKPTSATTLGIDSYDSIVEISFPRWATIFTAFLYFPIRALVGRGFIARGSSVLSGTSPKETLDNSNWAK
jgi:hypothetical protein